MSDTLCQVLDAAEFCRNVHVDEEWRRQAQQVCVELSGYVHELNTNYGLYSALARALRQHDTAAAASTGAERHASAAGVLAASFTSAAGERAAEVSEAAAAGGWDAEALLVGRMLKRDFERFGVHLDGEKRDRMTLLTHRSQALGMQFTQNVLEPSQLGQLELRGGLAAATARLPPHTQQRFRPLAAPGGSGAIQGVACPAETSLLHSLLRTSTDEGLRQAAFHACYRQPHANLAVLDSLVEARHEVARLMGFESFGSYQLDSFSLASHPDAVATFLQRFAADIAPKCAEEAAQMTLLKRITSSGGGGGSSGTAAVQPWDRQFLMAAGRSNEEADALSMTEYLELERVVEGLSELLRRSMGVQLQERGLEPGEGWAPGVRKLAAVHDTDGFLGIVYLDLYRRPQKFPSAAHFTLRCGRELPGGTYQTPVVALVANMAQHAGLSLGEVEMLFHEFGHALNSLLSRTRFQHLAGTRGPLDMVEVPSHTLELFASDPRVMALFARHRSTGEAPPPGLLRQLHTTKRRFVALEQQQQLQFCLIDQLLHGPDPPTGAAAQAQIADIMQSHSALGWAPGCHPHIRFTHLIGYGASYYSYLYAQCLSAAIWQDTLQADPLSRSAGELLRHRLLEPGGAKEARCMVADVLASSALTPSSTSGSRVTVGGLCGAAGGWYPDPTAMLRQQQLHA
ncbi:Mitochondrial intermediate peptidase [Chlorella vulgaris]